MKDVVPALKTNAEGLKTVLDDLLKQYKGKQDEMDTWKVIKKKVFFFYEIKKESPLGRTKLI